MTPTTTTPGNALHDWLSDLKQRGYQLTVTDGIVHLQGTSSDDHDRQMITRHRHALTIAANHTHPDWWNTILGRQPPHPNLDIPTTDDGYACTCCGQPAAHLDPNLLPWCHQHLNPNDL